MLTPSIGDPANARLLVVDDQEANVDLLVFMLERAGYSNVIGLTDPRAVFSYYAGDQQPDLLLLDLHMPHLDGFAVLERIQTLKPADIYAPTIVLTADITAAAKQRALSLGANDFLAKPFDGTEVLLRVSNLLQTRLLHRHLHQQNALLDEKVRVRTRDLQEAELEILERLALAAEYRDDLTGEHTHRVGQMSRLLAQAIGLPVDQVTLIERASPLHDVGKIGIPDHILLKADRLLEAEMEQMRTHTTIGARLLAGSRFPLLCLAQEIALSHHEHWNGGGYPQGLSGTAIPVAGRIVAVVDVFDALTHSRTYKAAWSVTDALAELARLSGSQFDPRLVQAFLWLQGQTCLPTAV